MLLCQWRNPAGNISQSYRICGEGAQVFIYSPTPHQHLLVLLRLSCLPREDSNMAWDRTVLGLRTLRHQIPAIKSLLGHNEKSKRCGWSVTPSITLKIIESAFRRNFLVRLKPPKDISWSCRCYWTEHVSWFLTFSHKSSHFMSNPRFLEMQCYKLSFQCRKHI